MRSILITLGALFGLSLWIAGCAARNDASEPPAEAKKKWDWSFHPPVNKMRIANLPCQLLPKSSLSIHSPLLGMLRVYIDQPQTNLPAGFIFAEFEPAILAAEAQALEEARVKLEERERLQLELELPKQRLRMERELEEAHRQVRLLHLLSSNQELAKIALNLPGQSGHPLKPEALEKAKVELGLIEQGYQYLQETNTAFLGVDLPGQRSEWQRRKLEFDRRQAQARLKMPFDGQLTLSVPLTEGVDEYPVNVSQEVAVVRDLTTIRLRVPISNPAWVGLPPEKLYAVVRLPTGQELQAPFVFQKIERLQAREESVYYFQFPPEQSAAAARLLGVEVACELWMTLPQTARVVSKLALILENPSAFQGRNWGYGVKAAWPGARLLIEGQTDLAIVLPEVTTTARK